MIRLAVERYFRLRAVAREMRVPTRWWWGNGRVLQALYEERVRRESGWRTLPKTVKLLDFRSYQEAPVRRSNAAPRQ